MKRFRKLIKSSTNERLASVVVPSLRLKSYQKRIIDVVLNDDSKRYIVACLPRQAGKDVMALFIAGIYMNQETPVTVHYIAHRKNVAIDIMFNTLLDDGERYCDIIGVKSVNKQEGTIETYNGSIMKVYGSDPNSSDPAQNGTLVGTHASLYIFTEFALQNPITWNLTRPKVSQSNKNSKVIFITTVRQDNGGSLNHFKQLVLANMDNPQWYIEKMGYNEIPIGEYNHKEAEDQLKSGMPVHTWRQDYLNDWDAVDTTGFVYASYIKASIEQGRVAKLTKNLQKETYTAWDIGCTDSTVVYIFQIDAYDTSVHILDMVVYTQTRLTTVYDEIIAKGYNYTHHFLPHDAKHETLHHEEMLSMADQLRKHQKNTYRDESIITIPIKPILQGISLVRNMFHKLYIDEINCRRLINGLQCYRKDFDEKTETYSDKPKNKQKFRDEMDALRYLATAYELYVLSKYKK